MHCSILTIGSELLEGSVINTNASFIGTHLSVIGLTPLSSYTVGDSKETLIRFMKKLSQDYNIVFTTGGIGPTFDDITAECAALASNSELEFNQEAFNHISFKLKKENIEIKESHKKQAYLPKGVILFNNKYGTALGFGHYINKCLFICMPGVPYEMKAVFCDEVIPYIKKEYEIKEIYSKNIHIAFTAESEVDSFIRDLNIHDNVECIINASSYQVVVKLRSEDEKQLNKTAFLIVENFSSNFIGYNTSIEEAFVNILKAKNLTVSTAESCTGGLIGASITNISGASNIYYGSIVSYDNSVKENLLNVEKDILEEFGAVSDETAKIMAEQVRLKMGTSIGISTTGIAGPSGAVKDKPVGTVFIGISNGIYTKVIRKHFQGNRDKVRTQAVNYALFSAIEFIRTI